MSTRAVYTFIDENETFHVYKDCDGYPEGAIQWISNAIDKAWEGPRFEAAEFGAAFIAANKTESGGVYLTHTYENHGDLEYRYEIRSSHVDGVLEITVFDYYGNGQIFCGTLHQMDVWIQKTKAKDE